MERTIFIVFVHFDCLGTRLINLIAFNIFFFYFYLKEEKRWFK